MATLKSLPKVAVNTPMTPSVTKRTASTQNPVDIPDKDIIKATLQAIRISKLTSNNVRRFHGAGLG